MGRRSVAKRQFKGITWCGGNVSNSIAVYMKGKHMQETLPAELDKKKGTVLYGGARVCAHGILYPWGARIKILPVKMIIWSHPSTSISGRCVYTWIAPISRLPQGALVLLFLILGYINLVKLALLLPSSLGERLKVWLGNGNKWNYLENSNDHMSKTSSLGLGRRQTCSPQLGTCWVALALLKIWVVFCSNWIQQQLNCCSNPA